MVDALVVATAVRLEGLSVENSQVDSTNAHTRRSEVCSSFAQRPSVEIVPKAAGSSERYIQIPTARFAIWTG